MVERAPADAVTGLEHEHRVPGGPDLARRAQAGQAGADDDHVGSAGSARGRAAGGGSGISGARGAADGNRACGRGRAAEQLAAADVGLVSVVHLVLPLVRGEGHSGDDLRRLAVTWTDGVATAAWH